jgi:hypothetical protein
MTAAVETSLPADEAPLQVTYADGKVVAFGKKKKADKDWHQAEDGQIYIDLYFKNGEFRSYGLQGELMTQFAAHGGLQKYGDNLAGITDVEEMVYESDELYNQLQRGEWSSKREGSGPTGSSILAKAFITFSLGGQKISGFGDMTPAEQVAAVAALPKDSDFVSVTERVKEFLRGLTQSEKTAFREVDETISPLVAALEAEKVKTSPKVDTASLLARF